MQTTFYEEHLTVIQIAQQLKLSPKTIRRQFRNQPGVVCIGKTYRTGKPIHQTLRIPRSVAEKLYQELQVR